MGEIMQVKSLELENYRVFREAKFADLPRMSVVVGANGSGKSTLFDVFSFMKEALAQNVAQAVVRRGGFRELISRGQEEEAIGITVKFRETHGRLATYELKIAEVDGQPVVDREVLRYRRGSYGKPWKFVDFSRGHGEAITNEAAYEEEDAKEERGTFELDDPSVLAIKGLGQFQQFRIVSEFRKLLENWHISNFQIDDARSSAEAGYAEHLSTFGENVAQVAQYLFTHHPGQFKKILTAMQQRVPGVNTVEAKPTEDGRLALRFKDGEFRDPFIARYVSDGTIKMFAYLVLLHDPSPHPLLAVEEPENQLYPHLFAELVEEFRGYADRGGQVFVSTHSPEFLNGTEPEEVYWLVKEQGFSAARRVSQDSNLKRLHAEGDKLGALWRRGLFEGAHP